ncbi:hypothetical protein DV515_00017500, partial [Chloebia gouldiae]
MTPPAAPVSTLWPPLLLVALMAFGECHQWVVEVEVESMDKAGNFIGWLHIEGVNLSVALVEQALSRVHFTAERSPYCKALLAAQDAAKQRKEK